MKTYRGLNHNSPPDIKCPKKIKIIKVTVVLSVFLRSIFYILLKIHIFYSKEMLDLIML